MSSRFVRSNGWERPYHPLQIVTWIIFPFLIALFYGVCLTNLGSVTLQASLGSITGVLAIVTLILDILTAKVNPKSVAREGDETEFCYHCNTDVLNNALHCNECNK